VSTVEERNEALGAVYLSMRRRLLARVSCRPGLQEEAEDLVQEVARLLVEKWDDVEDPIGWMLGTLRWRTIIFWRWTKRRGEEIAAASIPEHLLARPGVAAAIEARLDLSRIFLAISPRHRALLELLFLEGEKAGAAAQRLGYACGSIPQTRRRALALLGKAARGANLRTKARSVSLVGEERL